MRLMKLALVVTLVAAAYGVQAQADPTVGTWKLNLAKTKYNAGQAPKSTTLVIEAAGQGVKLTSNTVLADGTARKISYTATYDGKDAAVTGTPDYDTISLKKTERERRVAQEGGQSPPDLHARRVGRRKNHDGDQHRDQRGWQCRQRPGVRQAVTFRLRG